MDENQGKSKSLIEGMVIYAIGNFGTKILSFLIVPLYTYYISTEDMGVYDLLISTVNLLTPIITLQISDAAYRWMVRENQSKDVYIRATLQVLIINCFLASILILFINCYATIPFCGYFVLVLITSRALATMQKLLRGLNNQKVFAVSGIVYTVIFLFLNVVQICFFKRGVSSLFESAIIANIIALLFIFIIEPRMRINCFERPNVKLIREMLTFSAPLVPNQLNWWVINSSDRYIVNFFLGNSANGILAIAHKFPSMLQTVLNLFNTSWQDVSIADSAEDVGAYYTKVFRIYYKISFSMLWLLVPLTRIFIMLVMSTDYKVAADYVSFYYLGTIFQGFSSFYGVGYLRNKQTKRAFSTSIYGAVINAAINILFIKYIGLQAASISTFIGFLCMWLIRERQNKKELGITISWIEFIVFLMISIFVCIISNIITLHSNFLLCLIGTIAFIIINKKEIFAIVKMIRLKLNKK